MSTAARPKPWEVNSSGIGTASTEAVPAQTATASGPSTTTASDGVPSLPDRPSSLNSANPSAPYSYNSTTLPGTSSMTTGAYGSGGYGSYGSSGYGGYGSSGYGTGYGGYGSSYGTGYGGYGSTYGGYGGYGSSFGSPYSRFGAGGMYGGGYGGMGDPGAMGFRGGMENSTQATFQLIESIVGAVGGFAQMLESTYMATHSSFFAMVSVAEQFGHLKNSLGSILGVFAIMRWLRRLVARASGQSLPSEASQQLTPQNFAKFAVTGGNGSQPRRARPSFKPLLLFLAAVFGFPYLLGKVIRALALRQEEQQLQQHNGAVGPNGEPIVDPSKLEFCRALYDFVPENPSMELELRKGDLVAILSRTDPSGNASQWWRARTRDGRTGYIPSTYVEILPRKLDAKMIKDA